MNAETGLPFDRRLIRIPDTLKRGFWTYIPSDSPMTTENGLYYDLIHMDKMIAEQKEMRKERSALFKKHVFSSNDEEAEAEEEEWIYLILFNYDIFSTGKGWEGCEM